MEQKIIQAHNTLMQIMVCGDGAIRMAEALTLLREVVEEMKQEEQNEPTGKHTTC